MTTTCSSPEKTFANRVIDLVMLVFFSFPFFPFLVGAVGNAWASERVVVNVGGGGGRAG